MPIKKEVTGMWHSKASETPRNRAARVSPLTAADDQQKRSSLSLLAIAH